jgi:hypothetical protein
MRIAALREPPRRPLIRGCRGLDGMWWLRVLVPDRDPPFAGAVPTSGVARYLETETEVGLRVLPAVIFKLAR